MDPITACRIAAVSIMLAAAGPPVHADTWLIDKAHTEIRFGWDHLGLSRKSGRFLEFDGVLDFTPTEPTAGAVEVSIRTTSIATGVKALDDALRSPDFFNASAYPIITFRSAQVRATGDKSGEIAGEITILGVTRPIVLAATWNFTGEHPMAPFNLAYQGKWVSGFSATATLNRSEFGLKRAIPFASDEIALTIEAEFLRRE